MVMYSDNAEANHRVRSLAADLAQLVGVDLHYGPEDKGSPRVTIDANLQSRLEVWNRIVVRPGQLSLPDATNNPNDAPPPPASVEEGLFRLRALCDEINAMALPEIIPGYDPANRLRPEVMRESLAVHPAGIFNETEILFWIPSGHTDLFQTIIGKNREALRSRSLERARQEVEASGMTSDFVEDFMRTLVRLAGGEITNPIQIRCFPNSVYVHTVLGADVCKRAVQLIGMINDMQQSSGNTIKFDLPRTGPYALAFRLGPMATVILDKLKIHGDSIVELIKRWNGPRAGAPSGRRRADAGALPRLP